MPSIPIPHPVSVETSFGVAYAWKWESSTLSNKPSLLALHGWTGSGLDFESLVETTLPFFASIVAVDLPGHGQTCFDERQRPCTTEKVSYFLQETLASLGLNKSTTLLLGYSMGGRMALQWALSSQEAWAGIVLVGATPGLKTVAERLQRQESDEQRVSHIEDIGVVAFWNEWKQHPLIASQLRLPEPWLSRLETRRLQNTETGLALSLRGYGTGSMPSVWERLGELQTPTLLVTGEEDSKFCGIAEEMLSRLPNAEWEKIAAAGHAPHLEQTPETVAVLKEWMGRIL